MTNVIISPTLYEEKRLEAIHTLADVVEKQH